MLYCTPDLNTCGCLCLSVDAAAVHDAGDCIERHRGGGCGATGGGGGAGLGESCVVHTGHGGAEDGGVGVAAGGEGERPPRQQGERGGVGQQAAPLHQQYDCIHAKCYYIGHGLVLSSTPIGDRTAAAALVTNKISPLLCSIVFTEALCRMCICHLTSPAERGHCGGDLQVGTGGVQQGRAAELQAADPPLTITQSFLL